MGFCVNIEFGIYPKRIANPVLAKRFVYNPLIDYAEKVSEIGRELNTAAGIRELRDVELRSAQMDHLGIDDKPRRL